MLDNKYNINNPYLSVVVVARNDDYGVRQIDKINVFIKSLYFLVEKYKLFSELIFVEWNPPENNKFLYECLDIPKSNFIKSKFVIIPPEIHFTFLCSDKVKLFEYIGKNVGIRRSKGEFVLITNPDNLIGEGIIKKISEKKLKYKHFYRVGRYNIKNIIPPELSNYYLYLDFAQKNIEGWRGYIIYYSNIKFYIRYNPLKYIKGFLVNFLIPIFKYYPYQVPALCTPGDFILMSKKDWLDIKGFLEIPPYSYTGGDGALVHIALKNKLKQVYWFNFNNTCLYSQPQFDREIIKEIHSLTKEEINICFQILKGNFKNFNNDRWGLKDYNLKEISI
ncbi:MAG: hypothetical protein N2114_01350 [Candidatus Goldbacteria bacterium]|nr:hypothetical protein [Candidatus Goldiibacteriota bacterium]